jgi:hypothetical protein
VPRAVFERAVHAHLGLHSDQVRELVEAMQLARPLGGQHRRGSGGSSAELVDFSPLLQVAKILGVHPPTPPDGKPRAHAGDQSDDDDDDDDDDDYASSDGGRSDGAPRRRSRSRGRSSPRRRSSAASTTAHENHHDTLYGSRRLYSDDDADVRIGRFGGVHDGSGGGGGGDDLGVPRLYSLSDVERKLEAAYRRREWDGIDLRKVESLLATENAREEHRCVVGIFWCCLAWESSAPPALCRTVVLCCAVCRAN